MKRGAGILMPIFSIPNKGNYGTLGKESYDFVDFLVKSRQRYWQVLPINDVDVYGSPFCSTCIYSGNPLFVDLKGYLTKEEYISLEEDKCLDYKSYKELKMHLFYKAFIRGDYTKEIDEFKINNKWVYEYAVFMTMYSEYEHVSNFTKDKEKKEFLNKNESKIEFYIFTQYLFFKQWYKLKAYANSKGILIIGDSPCNSAMDSKEAYFDSKYYLLDEEYTPTFVAGVPPDYFSSLGQVWNTLIYNYEVIKNEGYKYLLDKYKYLLNVYDYLKIDHFRGLEYYYMIPYGEKDGRKGEWVEGPGYPFIDLLRENKIDNLILEDLGIISEGVVRLKEYSKYPGMKVFSFAFGESNSPFLPEYYNENCIAYTGTHDNDTFYSFLEDDTNKEKVCKYLNIDKESMIDKIIKESIRSLYKSRADVVIINPQDLLNEGNESRFNTPGTILGNWLYNCNKKLYSKDKIEFLINLVEEGCR